jgi:hypothetical protein
MEIPMRTSFLLPLAAVALLSGPAGGARAGDGVRAVIDRAIQAVGGAERIDRVKAGRTQTRGTLHRGGKTFDFTQETFYQWPDQFKGVLALEGGGKKLTITTVSSGDKGWVNFAGRTKELEDRALDEANEERNLANIGRLTSLSDRTFELAALAEVTMTGRPTVGVKVMSRGYRDVSLYFDKNTGLLVMTQRYGVDASSGKEFREEKVLSDYRDVDGLKSPRRVVIYRDGKTYMEVEVTGVKYLEKLDESVFAKP